MAAPGLVPLEDRVRNEADPDHRTTRRRWERWPRVSRRFTLRAEATMTFDFEEPPSYEDVEDPADRLRRLADRVASMIVTSTCTDLECALAERELRMECLSLIPDRMELYDLVYTARFRRLREQFRAEEAWSSEV